MVASTSGSVTHIHHIHHFLNHLPAALLRPQHLHHPRDQRILRRHPRVRRCATRFRFQPLELRVRQSDSDRFASSGVAVELRDDFGRGGVGLREAICGDRGGSWWGGERREMGGADWGS